MRSTPILCAVRLGRSAVVLDCGCMCRRSEERSLTNDSFERKTSSLGYTLKLDNQSVVDTNVGKEPLKVTQGSHQIIPGVEKQIEGMAVGEKKKFW